MKIQAMAGTKHDIIELAWQEWLNHTETCADCQELLRLARKSDDKEKAFWMVGFSTAMDMLSEGKLMPMIKPSAN